MSTTLIERPPTRSPGPIRSAWAGAHAPVAGVPRWARLVAYAIPFTVLPSSLWRISVCTLHLPIARPALDIGSSSGIQGLPLAAYVVILSVVSELLAFTAVGLVARWGEVFPRWIPVLRGRRVPVLGAVVPAAAGATFLTLLWTWVAVTYLLGRRIDGSVTTGVRPLGFDDWQGWIAVVAYAPLILWGPLLGAVTFSYWRRRCGTMAA